jgi:hypothetical protein
VVVRYKIFKLPMDRAPRRLKRANRCTPPCHPRSMELWARLPANAAQVNKKSCHPFKGWQLSTTSLLKPPIFLPHCCTIRSARAASTRRMSSSVNELNPVPPHIRRQICRLQAQHARGIHSTWFCSLLLLFFRFFRKHDINRLLLAVAIKRNGHRFPDFFGVI